MSDQKKTYEFEIRLQDSQALASLKAESTEFAKAARSAEKLSDSVDKVGRSQKEAAESAGNLGSKVGGLATGLLASVTAYLSVSTAINTYSQALTYVAKVGGDFEQSLANTRAVLQPTDREFQALSASAKNLGATTVFTASQAGDAYTELGKLGFDAAQILAAGNDVLVLAAAANLDMATAATAAATVVRQFGLEAGQTGEVVDIMAKSFSISALDAGNFTEAMQYVGPAARSAGISVSEASAALGVLSDNGIKGSMAGTSLRRIILELSDATSDASKAVRAYNPEAKTLVEKMEALSKAGLDTTSATELFRVEASTAAIVLAGGTDTLTKYGEALRYAEGGAKGFAKGVADIQLDTFQGDLKLAESAAEGAAIAFAEAFGPSARDAVQSIVVELGNLNKWADENPDKLRAWGETAKTIFDAAAAAAKGVAKAVELANDALTAIAGEKVAANQEDRFIQVADKIGAAYQRAAKHKADLERFSAEGGISNTGEIVRETEAYNKEMKVVSELTAERDRLFTTMIEYRNALSEDKGRSDADQKTLDRLNQMIPAAAEAVRKNKTYAQSIREIGMAEADRLKGLAAGRAVTTKGAGNAPVESGIASSDAIEDAAKVRAKATQKADEQYYKLLREKELSELDADRRALRERLYYWDEVIGIDKAAGGRHIDNLEAMRDQAIAAMLRPDVAQVYEVRGRVISDRATMGGDTGTDGGQAAGDAAAKAREQADLARDERRKSAESIALEADESRKSEIQLEEEKYGRQLEMLREFHLNEESLEAEHNEKMRMLYLARIESSASLVGGLAALATATAGNNKKMLMAAKVLATTEATMNTYVAANKAFATAGGFPWGVIPAAASIAYGMANVAQINDLHFEQGSRSPDASFGDVGGSKYYGDKIPAMLSSGERVLSRTENKEYKRGMGGDTFNVKFNASYSSDTSPQQKRKDQRAFRRTMKAVEQDRSYKRSQAAIV